MLMSRNGKNLTLAMALVLAVSTVIIVYPQRLPEKLPDCKCIYQITKKYGIIKNGKCVVTECERKAPKKTPEK